MSKLIIHLEKRGPNIRSWIWRNRLRLGLDLLAEKEVYDKYDVLGENVTFSVTSQNDGEIHIQTEHPPKDEDDLPAWLQEILRLYNEVVEIWSQDEIPSLTVVVHYDLKSKDR